MPAHAPVPAAPRRASRRLTPLAIAALAAATLVGCGGGSGVDPAEIASCLQGGAGGASTPASTTPGASFQTLSGDALDSQYEGPGAQKPEAITSGNVGGALVTVLVFEDAEKADEAWDSVQDELPADQASAYVIERRGPAVVSYFGDDLPAAEARADGCLDPSDERKAVEAGKR